jgi:nitrate reductase cytochrome c-type subunit
MKKNLLVAFLMLCFVFAGVFAQEADIMLINEDVPAATEEVATEAKVTEAEKASAADCKAVSQLPINSSVDS